MMKRTTLWALLAPFAALSSLLVAPRLSAQERGAPALGELAAGLGTTTRVLMIGAHPDDEDTQLIAYLAKAKHIETAYLSLTRGDGGQNLIGNELGPVLGMIRTEELLAARRIDGGHQYFSRAFDFGFSKSLDETLRHWPKDSILSDAVAIVRAYRPQVIIAVFTGTPADGHGHHQFSGVIAREVFDAAADTVRFPPSKLGGLAPWTPLKFYRLRRNGGGGTLSFNAGELDPLLGVSYSELATVSRSQHRSQGQGALPQRGPRFSGVQLEASRVSDPTRPEQSLFDGIDTTWARFRALSLPRPARSALDSLPLVEATIRASLDLRQPARSVANLATYVRLGARAEQAITCTTHEVLNADTPSCRGSMGDLALSLNTMRGRAIDALLDAAGVAVEATAPRELIAVRDTMPVTVSVYNRGADTVALESVALLDQPGMASKPARPILPDSVARQVLRYVGDESPTTAWWLRRPMRGETFNQPLADMITGEDHLHTSGVEAVVRIDGVSVPVTAAPIVYRFADPARGEVRRPVATVPEISVLLEHEIEYARAATPLDRSVLVNVHSAATAPRDVDIALVLPAGLSTDTAHRHVTLAPYGDATVYFRVRGRVGAGRDSIRAIATAAGKSFALGFVPVEYEHIRPLRYYRRSTVQVEAVNATFANLRLGYIRGVGDNVMPMLEELGLPVTELDPRTLPQVKLSGFSTIVVGPRAYEASKALVANNPLLMQFVRKGGAMVVQYGQFPYQQAGILPYPISLTRPAADRVTDENAPVRVIDPGSPIVTTPNRIAEQDFANWVQERSSYMPRTFDKQYRTVFSLNDPGEPPNDAAVLVAPMGTGTYIYTTFSFFRQLPAGNPGAARLFINLLSANQRAATRPVLSPSVPAKP
jgi:LmbE family N-acetylglucosaminyl deacetylase